MDLACADRCAGLFDGVEFCKLACCHIARLPEVVDQLAAHLLQCFDRVRTQHLLQVIRDVVDLRGLHRDDEVAAQLLEFAVASQQLAFQSSCLHLTINDDHRALVNEREFVRDARDVAQKNVGP